MVTQNCTLVTKTKLKVQLILGENLTSIDLSTKPVCYTEQKGNIFGKF